MKIKKVRRLLKCHPNFLLKHPICLLDLTMDYIFITIFVWILLKFLFTIEIKLSPKNKFKELLSLKDKYSTKILNLKDKYLFKISFTKLNQHQNKITLNFYFENQRYEYERYDDERRNSINLID